MIISRDAKKVFDKIQHLYDFLKTLRKLENEGNYQKLIKMTYRMFFSKDGEWGEDADPHRDWAAVEENQFWKTEHLFRLLLIQEKLFKLALKGT